MPPIPFRLALIAGLLSLPATTWAAAPPPPPPVSDGSSGSWDAQFKNGEYLQWFNTDTGVVHSGASGGFTAFTVPFKVVKYNGQKLNAYNFTDINVEPTVALTIYGSKPALLLANQPISIAGQLNFQTNAGAAGAEPNGVANGGNGGNAGGGFGGSGGGGETQGAFCTETSSAGGAGGGGNYAAGQPGLKGTYPVDAPNPTYTPPGLGGVAENPNKLQGGGGGGAGGGSNAFGNNWDVAGANGGGALAFATTSTFTITSTGVLSVNGVASPGSAGNSGASGGGAGGDIWITATGAFANAGALSARGGAGTNFTIELNCAGTASGPGPNGGAGAARAIKIAAPTIQNNGLIDVSTGGGGTANGGYVGLTGSVVKGTGTIIGRKGKAT